MADIVNLRSARKARARTETEAKAAANRLLHGQSKAEKRILRDEAARQAAALDGARRETDEKGEDRN